MKKTIFVFAAIFLLGPALFATTLLDTKDVVVNTSVPIAATLILPPLGQTADSGMPFDITGSDVAWNQSTYSSGTGGRHIADWTLETNMASVSLSINATPLTNTASNDTIGYHLLMSYSYYTNGNPSAGTTSGVFKIHSNETVSCQLTNGPVYFANKGINFMFDNEADPAHSPDGGYRATLTITLTEGIN